MFISPAERWLEDWLTQLRVVRSETPITGLAQAGWIPVKSDHIPSRVEDTWPGVPAFRAVRAVFPFILESLGVCEDRQ